MVERLRVTVLSENTAGRRDVLAEHGLSLWVEADDRRILFDTGQGLVLAHNAQVLDIQLNTAQTVVLSHGHYDHTGGLIALRDEFQHANVYVHPVAFQERYSLTTGQPARATGAALSSLRALAPHVSVIVSTPDPTQVAPGVWVTGEIPRRTDYEDTGGPFYLDAGGTRADPLIDDQAMYIDTKPGMTVLLGCAHAGVVNTLDYISELTGQRRFHAVLGGMHLLRASTERIEHTIAALRKYDVHVVAPLHCTGLNATARLLEAFPERFLKLAAGTVATLS